MSDTILGKQGIDPRVVQLANQIKNTDATISGILLSTMNVGRAVEGGPVTPGNPFP